MSDGREWLGELRRKYLHILHGGTLDKDFDLERIVEGAERAADELDQLKRTVEWFRAAHWLLANEYSFIAPADGEFCFVAAEMSTDGDCKLALNMSDTFAFACADAEDFLYSEAPELVRIAKEEGWPGLNRWAAAKRGMRPIPPVEEHMEEYDGALAEAKAELETLRALPERLREMARDEACKAAGADDVGDLETATYCGTRAAVLREAIGDDS